MLYNLMGAITPFVQLPEELKDCPKDVCALTVSAR